MDSKSQASKTLGKSFLVLLVAFAFTALLASTLHLMAWSTNREAIAPGKLDRGFAYVELVQASTDLTLADVETDMEITKTVNTISALPGEIITYTLAFTNNGPDDAISPIIITDTLPLGACLLISSTTPPYSETLLTDNLYTWIFPPTDFISGSVGTITLTAAVSDSLESDYILTNTAGITASADITLTNNFASVETVVQRADVVITKTVEPKDKVLPGQTLTYTIEYANIGTADAEDVTITDSLPISVTEVITSADPDIPSAESKGNVYTWTLGALPVGYLGEITITAKVTTVHSAVISGTHLVNRAWITTTTPEITITNNITSVSSVVGQVAGVEIAPDGAGTALPNTVVDYTHIVTNTGNGSDTIRLEAASSQGWEVELSSSSASLKVGGSVDITVNITVPVDAPSGMKDKTVITATSEFDNSKWDTVTDITGVEHRMCLLPLVLKGYCTPDRYEPNNTTSEAFPIELDREIQAYFCPDDPDDFYSISITAATDVTIDLTHVPSQSDYDLYLYNSALDCKGYSNTGGLGDYESIPISLEADTYYIRVFPFHKGPDSLQPYSLRVSTSKVTYEPNRHMLRSERYCSMTQVR